LGLKTPGFVGQRVVLAAVVAALLLPGEWVSAGEPTEKPNIVLLNIDDHGMSNEAVWTRLQTIKSLFIDHGISFLNNWNNFPLCCPGRATQLTGQEAHHHGVTNNNNKLLDESVTIATELHDVGYYTILAGKYLNQSDPDADKTPPGWDHAAIFGSGYYRRTVYVDDVAEYHGSLEEDYTTDVSANHSLTFLKSAPAKKPLFAYLNPYGVHQGADIDGIKVGTQPAPAERHKGDSRCSGVPKYAPANYNEADVSDKPYYIRRIRPFKTTGFSMTRVCETLLSVDEWLGRVVTELHKQGRFDNTVFILTTDNGRGWGSNRLVGKLGPYSARTLLYVYWPAVMNTDHSFDKHLLSNVDLAPTLCELGGCDGMGPFANGFNVDGQSFAGLIAPGLFSSVPSRDGIVLEHLGPASVVPRWRGVITSPQGENGQWFWIEYTATGERELYKLGANPCITWSVGQPFDPCMLRNLAYGTKWKPMRTKLHNLLTALW